MKVSDVEARTVRGERHRLIAGMLWAMASPKRVFLSHTSELRRLPVGGSFVDAAESAVIEADGTPIDMAHFCADPRPPAQVCQEAVRHADVFVGIVGFRYGSPVSDRPELSYTELEFDEATRAGMPRLVFLLGEDVQGPAELFWDPEHGLRQVAFRSSLSKREITTATVTSPDGLGNALYKALVKLGHGAGQWREAVWAVPPLRGDEVPRPGLMEALVAAVTRPGASAVGMTTGLWGAGGFGKTTMARLLVHRPEVKEQFPEGVAWVTLGEDVAGPELAERVTNVVSLLCEAGARTGLTDPLAAGAELGRVLGDRRVLLVIDDVWASAQIEPFLVGGSATVRLFTTRMRGVLPGSAESVQVDEMARIEAESLLTAGVSGTSRGVVESLLAATGRWPVLLALVNGAVRADLNAGLQVDESMREIVHELRTTGPTALDITDAEERHTAVARTIGVSLARLTAEQRARYLELAVFGEDVKIPGAVLARYWKATGGLSEFQTRRHCRRLADLALVSVYRRDPEHVVLHDVIRDFLREQTQHRRGELDRALIDAHRSLVTGEGGTSAWWQLPAEQTYLWVWLVTHLWGAGLAHELRGCLHDPRWLVGKLEYVGPAGLEADLALSNDPLSRALGRAVRQDAHILGPLQPSGSLVATLATRLPGNGPTKALAEALVAGLTTPHLRAITALPDLPHPALSRVLTGHTSGVSALVVEPDGSWLASSSRDGEVRIWDLATGTARYTLTGHISEVTALVAAPDGSWLAAAASWDEEVRIWDPATGTARYTLTGHTGGVSALVAAPDGSWLASSSWDGEVRIWDPAIGTARYTLTGHTGGVSALVAAPDGSWLAFTSGREVQIWNPTTGSLRNTLTGHTNAVTVLVVAPDGSWLASAADYGKVRIWDPTTGTARRILTGHSRGVTALVVAPDGSWLAAASGREVWIWDPTTGTARHTLTGHSREVSALVLAPDGSWLASSSLDGNVRIWDPTIGTARHTLTGHTHEVTALMAAPDGSWLAAADTGGQVRIWDPATSIARPAPTGHTSEVTALAAAPDGSWLAAAGWDGEVRIWDPATGTARHTLTGHISGVNALVVAPDGSYLAATTRYGRVRIWDLTTGTTRYTFANRREVTALVVAPNGSWLAFASGNGVQIWDPITGTAHPALSVHSREVTALVVAPDGSWLAAANDREVRIWDSNTRFFFRCTLTGHTRGVSALVVAPDGSWLAAASGRAVWIWDPTTGTARHTLTGHTHEVTALVAAPDGSWLAAASGREVRIWDPATGIARRTLTGHTREVTALVAAQDRSWLASSSWDGEIRIWNLTTGATLTALRVAGDLSHLLLVSTTIAAAGERGLYFLALCP